MENLPEGLRQRGYTNPYSCWHWDLNEKEQGLYMLDIDSIEVRGNKPVAIIELRTTPTPLNDWQKSIVLKIGKAINVPVYLVHYAPDFKVFKVINQETDESKVMSEREYIKFLKELK